MRGLVSDIHDDDLEFSDIEEDCGFFDALTEDDCKRLYETDFEYGYNTNDVKDKIDFLNKLPSYVKSELKKQVLLHMDWDATTTNLMKHWERDESKSSSIQCFLTISN